MTFCHATQELLEVWREGERDRQTERRLRSFTLVL